MSQPSAKRGCTHECFNIPKVVHLSQAKKNANTPEHTPEIIDEIAAHHLRETVAGIVSALDKSAYGKLNAASRPSRRNSV